MYRGMFIYNRESSIARSMIYHTLTSLLIKNYIRELVGAMSLVVFYCSKPHNPKKLGDERVCLTSASQSQLINEES